MEKSSELFKMKLRDTSKLLIDGTYNLLKMLLHKDQFIQINELLEQFENMF